nr:SE1832 family protein [Salsuginibacillus kocurii]
MTKPEIEQKLANLKSDYARIQGDLDKLESIGGNSSGPIRELELIESEMAELNARLRGLEL